jgi:hypothetical protein
LQGVRRTVLRADDRFHGGSPGGISWSALVPRIVLPGQLQSGSFTD